MIVLLLLVTTTMGVVESLITFKTTIKMPAPKLISQLVMMRRRRMKMLVQKLQETMRRRMKMLVQKLQETMRMVGIFQPILVKSKTKGTSYWRTH